jgi:NADH-quinone oxidoreductase subunit J
MGTPIVFSVLAAIALISALGMLLSRNAVHSILFLVLNFGTIAVFFLVLNAPFLFVTQLTIYAGAIMVLFLFVVMLLGAERLRGKGTEVGGWQAPLSLLLAVLLLLTFGYVLYESSEAVTATSEATIVGGPVEIGLVLFESYVFPFEVASVLLLVAMVGVVALRLKRGKNA